MKKYFFILILIISPQMLFAQINPVVTETTVLAIEKAIQTPGVRVRAVKNQIILEGVAYSEAQAAKAYEIAKLYVPDCINLIEVRAGGRHLGEEKMVQLDVYFMEIQKSALKAFGIQWAPGSFPKDGGGNLSFGAASQSSGGLGNLGQSLLGFVLNLLPKIRFAKEHGLGRVLENATLFVKSGDAAQFFSGVQVPYYASDNVQFKEIGVKIEAEPIVSANDVDLKLNASLSSPSSHMDGGINTHSISTTAFIPSGNAVVLGGLISNQDVKTYNRIPRDLVTSSAIFSLFLSKDFQNSNSELVVFALPSIVGALPKAIAAQENWKSMEADIHRDQKFKEYVDYMQRRLSSPRKRGSR